METSHNNYISTTETYFRLLLDTWGFDCSCDGCVDDTDLDIRNFLIKLRTRMKEKLCAGDFRQVYKLHCQKLRSVEKMKTRNHNELLNSHQVRN